MKPVLLGSPGQCTHLEKSPDEIIRGCLDWLGLGKHSWGGDPDSALSEELVNALGSSPQICTCTQNLHLVWGFLRL